MATKTDNQIAKVKRSPAGRKFDRRPRRTPEQIEAAENAIDATVATQRIATNKPEENRSLDDLRKALGR